VTVSSLILGFVPAAPALAAALIAFRAARSDAAIARVTAGATVIALAAAIVACQVDRLGGFVACAVAAIALIVVGYASRSLQGSTVPYARFFSRISAATAASLTVAVASDVRVLAAGWIATGLATSALLDVVPGRPAARRWARRHLAVERIGDVAWIVILIVAFRTYGTFDLAALGHAASLVAPPVGLALAIVVAGAVRSAIVPFHGWLPNSMEAPTPVSAFMHAGLVNGAAVLFVKTASIVAGAPAALAIAALLGGLTAAIGATIALVRPESKRRLGWSTVAQMGFMVLQCGCGAFAAAVIHLVAHGGYKSAAFLGVAGSIDANARSRRHPAHAAVSQRFAQALTSFVPPTLGIVLACIAVRDHLAGLPAAALVIALAWTTGVCAARGVAECALPMRPRLVAGATIAASVVAYVAAVVALDAWLGNALPRATFAPAAIVATLIVAAAGVLEGAGFRPRGSDVLYTLALTEGRAVRGALRA
jgi:hypothetical protein